VFAAFQCGWKLQHTVAAVAGGRGMLLDRWFNTGSELGNPDAATSLPAQRGPPDGSWVVVDGGFTAPRDVGNNFGTRLRAIFTPKASGPHTFWIKSDDCGVLLLSTDASPVRTKLIAANPHATNSYSTYPSQQSTAVQLVAGRRYYIEAIAIEVDGGDHLEVCQPAERFARSPADKPQPALSLSPDHVVWCWRAGARDWRACARDCRACARDCCACARDCCACARNCRACACVCRACADLRPHRR
jgi:hypothetical protein